MKLEIKISPLPLLREQNKILEQCVELTINAASVVPSHNLFLIVKEDAVKKNFNLGELREGKSIKEIFLPEVNIITSAEWIFNYGDKKVILKTSRNPVRKWNINLVLHSHTDLGFTAPISDVARIHNDNTDLAVMYAKETSGWPDGSKFKWTCEISWQIQNYLKERNETQIKNFIQEVKKNRIEIAALYAGEHTDLLGDEEAIRSFYLAAELRRKYKINIDSVMLSDVPGCTIGFVQIMARAGMKNFNLADNNFIAPFLKRTDLPRPFYWAGEDNSKILSWYTDHPFYAYIEGQNYGLSESYIQVREKLPTKLIDLEYSGYVYDELQLQYAFDNFRIEFRPAVIVREWNEKWAYPKIRLSTIREFFDRMRNKYDPQIPTVKGDWTNWWGNIVTAYPKETSHSRILHNKIPRLETLTAVLDGISNSYAYPDNYQKIYENNLAFDEHSGNGMVWEAKSEEIQNKALCEGYRFIHNAVHDSKKIEEDLINQLSASFQNEYDISIAVVNTSNQNSNGIVAIKINPNKKNLRLIDLSKNAEVEFILNKNNELKFYAEDVPGIGFKKYKIADDLKIPAKVYPKKIEPIDNIYFIENNFYKISINGSGIISSVFDKSLRKEIIKDKSFSQPAVYRAKKKNAIEMGKFIPDVYNGVKVPLQKIDLYKQSIVNVDECFENEIEAAVKISFRINNFIWLRQTIKLPKFTKQIEIKNEIPAEVLYNAALRKKLGHAFTESGILYFNFPFKINNAKFIYDAPCAVIDPEEMQLNGTCKDFYSIKNWCALQNKTSQISFANINAPLVDIGSPGLMQYKEENDEDASSIFVRAFSIHDDQMTFKSPYFNSKSFNFNVVFTSGKNSSITEIEKWGNEIQQPLMGIFLRKNKNGIENKSGKLINISPSNLKLITVKKAEENDDLIIRLKEIEGKSEKAEIELPGRKIFSAFSSMITEEKLERLKITNNKIFVSLSPYEISTIRIKLK